MKHSQLTSAFHLQRTKLLNWHRCRRVVLPRSVLTHRWPINVRIEKRGGIIGGARTRVWPRETELLNCTEAY